MSTFIELNRLEGILATEYKNNIERARDLDNSTRTVHRCIWLFRNEHRFVFEVIVPLFEEAINILQQTQETGENRKYIEHITETIRLRRKNLDTYLRGKPSNYVSVECIGQVG